MKKRKRPLLVTRQTVKKLTGADMDQVVGAANNSVNICAGRGNDNGAGTGISDTVAAVGQRETAVVNVGGVEYRVVGGVYHRVVVVAFSG